VVSVLRGIWNWFASRTARDGVDLHRHIRRLLANERDQMPAEEAEEVAVALAALNAGLTHGAPPPALRELMQRLSDTAHVRLPSIVRHSHREFVEVLLVAGVVVLTMRAFFLAPMKIPTGSMQPTLYGVTVEELQGLAEATAPTGFRRLLDRVVYGFNYVRGKDGAPYRVFSGDHVLVDRLSCNFRRPGRGEIVVFETRGVPGIRERTHYMKRLVALPGERVRIGNDRHLVVNGRRLDASVRGFEGVYSRQGPPRESEYSGYVNDRVAQRYRIEAGLLAPLFPDERTEYRVPAGHLLVMGDNTMASSDSRRWGALPRDRVIGRFWMVYWPVSARFGWTAR